MSIPTVALIPEAQTADLMQLINSRLATGKDFWRPLNARQDYWSLMYFLQDVLQQMKPVGYRRFISNEPRTAVDLAMSILTRNDSFWRIALFEEMNENAEMQRVIGKIERTLQGFIYAADEMFRRRGTMRFWKKAAAQALLRGWVWGKVHVTTDALKYWDTPLIAEIYDARAVYPHFDAFGLNYVLIEDLTTLGALMNLYPDKFLDYEIAGDKKADPNTPAIKLEYWSNDRGDAKGINAVLCGISPSSTTTGYDVPTLLNTGASAARWLIPPYAHGYHPTALPVVGVPVNGINIIHKPALGDLLTARLQERQDLLGMPSTISWFSGTNSWVAETGRSILSSVEEHVPQFNELVATILQHLSLSAYGTWVAKTPRGEFPNFEPGIEGRIALTPEESIERLQIPPINGDAYNLVRLIDGERQNGMLSNILRAQMPQGGDATGVLFQQMANAALNTLEPFHDGLEEFGEAIGTSILAQLQAGGSAIKSFDLIARASSANQRKQTFFVVEFDPKKDLALFRGRRPRPRVIFKPALPDDLAVRINAARLALDPRRPILSLVTVLENILQIEDPMEEIDRIWEDMANMDPVIVLEQIGAALERLGESELAERIRENQFKTEFIKELAFRQQTGNLPGAPSPGGGPGVPGGGLLGPPEAGGGSATTGTQPGGAPPSGAPPGPVGAMGERSNP